LLSRYPYDSIPDYAEVGAGLSAGMEMRTLRPQVDPEDPRLSRGGVPEVQEPVLEDPPLAPGRQTAAPQAVLTPSMLHWFGPNAWCPPICRDLPRTETPMGATCDTCQTPITARDRGVTLPFLGTVLVFHLPCFQASSLDAPWREDDP
jgi:hypothetical protein